MNGYITDAQMMIVKQIQAERRAEAAANRVAADWRRGHPAPADPIVVQVARLVVTIVLVAVGIGGVVGTGTLAGAGAIPADGPTPGFPG